jgi:hypothetical protein
MNVAPRRQFLPLHVDLALIQTVSLNIRVTIKSIYFRNYIQHFACRLRKNRT